MRKSRRPAMLIGLISGVSTIAASDLNAQSALRAPVPYLFVIDSSHRKARLDATERYHSGEMRVIFLDGKPTRLAEAQIVADVHSGHIVPVYQKSRERLSNEDWIASLPGWLGQATINVAGPPIPDEPDR